MPRSHLKNIFWPNIFVGASFQILEIQQYACGLRPTKMIGSGGKSSNAGKLGPAAILNKNPIFEMASNNKAPPVVPEYFKKSLLLIPAASFFLLPSFMVS